MVGQSSSKFGLEEKNHGRIGINNWHVLKNWTGEKVITNRLELRIIAHDKKQITKKRNRIIR
jgi:hypothetical protein